MKYIKPYIRLSESILSFYKYIYKLDMTDEEKKDIQPDWDIQGKEDTYSNTFTPASTSTIMVKLTNGMPLSEEEKAILDAQKEEPAN